MALAVLGWAAAAASARWWTADDAFISFRYAANLVEGRGLVFNEGERVEGFTNLLWTLWAAVGLRLGVAAERWANAWGLACYLAAIGLLLLRRRRAGVPARGAGAFWLPVAAAGAALSTDWAIWAVSGLETALFALLLTAAFLAVAGPLGRDEDAAARWALGGALAALAALTRPDGLLPAWVLGLAALVWGRPRGAAPAVFAAGFVALWLPPTLWRVAYFGDFFPNTYYAKSAWIPWYEQGRHYVELFFRRYWALLAGPVLLLAGGLAGLIRAGREPNGAARHRPVVLALAVAVTYTWYVARVGGDFMFARLLVPVLPFYLIALEDGLIVASRVAARSARLAGALLLAGLALTPTPVGGTDWVHGIADERGYYSSERVAALDHSAEVLRRSFAGLPVRVAFYGDEARIVYKAAFPVAIEAHAGLTDREVARGELAVRGRVGHEKHASLDYLVQRRAVHFSFSRVAGELLDLRRRIPEVIVQFDPEVYGQVLHWDPQLMAELARRGIAVPDFPAALDAAIARLDAMPDDQVAALWERVRLFYFLHHDDPLREAAFRRRLGADAGGRGGPRSRTMPSG